VTSVSPGETAIATSRRFIAFCTLMWPIYGAIYLAVLSLERPIGTPQEVFFLGIVWIEAALVTPWLMRRVQRDPLWVVNNDGALARHVRFGVMLVLGEVAVNNVAMWWVTGNVLSGNVPLAAALALKLPTSLLYGAMIYACIILIASAAAAIDRWVAQLTRKRRLEGDALTVELDRFRTRVEPQLVHVALTRISEEIDRSVAVAEEGTHQLADFLRSTLDSLQRDSVLIDDELRSLREYLALLAFSQRSQLGALSRRGGNVLLPAGIFHATLSSMNPQSSGTIEGEIEGREVEEGVHVTLLLSGLTLASIAPSQSIPKGVEARANMEEGRLLLSLLVPRA
jgi:hypothetical protein